MEFKNIEELIDVLNSTLSQFLGVRFPKSRLKDSLRVSQTAGNIVLSLPDYSLFIEAGRKAGKLPNIGSLIAWIKRRNIKVNGYTTEQLAFAIGRTIANKGIKARPFLSDFEDLALKQINKYIQSTKILK